MKILLFNWQDLKHSFSGGAEIYLHEVLKRLARKGNEVTWLGCREKNQEKEEFYDNMHFFRLGRWEFANLSIPFLFSKIKKKISFDIVIECISKAPFFTPLFVKRKPVVGFVPHLFGKTIYQETNFFIGSYVYLLEKPLPLVFRKKNFIVISESTKQELKERGIQGKRFSVVYPGIEHDKYKPCFEKEKFPLVLYLGRIKKYKKIDTVLFAFKEVNKELNNAKLYIVGDGDYREKLEKLTRDLCLESAVKFLGFLKEEEKIKLLQRAWLIVNTSPKEGWGMVNTEAQACGTPCVTFSSPGLRETIKHNKTGFLVAQNNLKEFIEKILFLLKNKEVREKFSRDAAQWSKNFTWEISAEKFEKVLFEIYNNFYYNKK